MWAVTEMSSVPHVGPVDRAGEQQCSLSWLWDPQPRLLGRSKTSLCYGKSEGGFLHWYSANRAHSSTPLGRYSEVILIVLPCEAIRSGDMLASQHTTLTANIYQTSSLYSKSIGSYICYYTPDLCWVHRKSVRCWNTQTNWKVENLQDFNNKCLIPRMIDFAYL